jgi:hypothetical protein
VPQFVESPTAVGFAARMVNVLMMGFVLHRGFVVGTAGGEHNATIALIRC